MKNTGSDLVRPKPPVESQSETCFRLIYRSRSLLPDKPDDGDANLASILNVSRKNNQKQDVTGALLLNEQHKRFAQVLEGAEGNVLELFERLKSDKRHDSIEIYEAGPAPKRLFSHWSWAMALVVEPDEPDMPLSVTVSGLDEPTPLPVVTTDQEKVLSLLRELTRDNGSAS